MTLLKYAFALLLVLVLPACGSLAEGKVRLGSERSPSREDTVRALVLILEHADEKEADLWLAKMHFGDADSIVLKAEAQARIEEIREKQADEGR